MTLHDLYSKVPTAIQEMEREFFRSYDVQFAADRNSQASAALMLAIRGTSNLVAMPKLLQVDSFDMCDVLQRSFMETRDLLTTFRLDREESRAQIKDWLARKGKDTWKADHKGCEQFFGDVGAQNLALAARWGKFSSLSHPTHLAASNSLAIRASSLFSSSPQDLKEILEEKIADYITATVSLFIAATFEYSGWVSLGCDPKCMPTAEELRVMSLPVINPLLARVEARGVANTP